VSGVWLPHELVARTRQGKRTESPPVLRYRSLEVNDPTVTEQDFTMQALERRE